MPLAPVEPPRAGSPRFTKGRAHAGPPAGRGARGVEELAFVDARVADISERAGMSHGSFYHYVDSKEQVFRELAEAVDARLSTSLGGRGDQQSKLVLFGKSGLLITGTGS